MNSSIKFKTTFSKKSVIDWKSIKEKEEVNNKFNVNLRNRLKVTRNYTKFNDAILRSGEETATKKSNKDQGWYHFSRDTITPPLRPETLSCMLSEPNTTLRYKVHFVTPKHSNRSSTKQ